MFILVYFQGRPTHICSSWSIFRADRPTHSRSLFSWATCPHTHIGLFSGATYTHMFIVVYFQGRPAHICSSWSIFKGNLPTHSHGLFSWATCPYIHIGLFSWATCPHMFILVYFQGRPAPLTRSIFMGDLPHTHIGLFSRPTCPHMFILVYFQG